METLFGIIMVVFMVAFITCCGMCVRFVESNWLWVFAFGMIMSMICATWASRCVDDYRHNKPAKIINSQSSQ